MLVCLLLNMLNILVLCPVLLIAGVQTLTIDSQLGTSIEDCFERVSIGEHLPSDAIYRNVSELTNRECEHICKQDKQCQAYDYGVGAKGNATCNLSTLDEKTIKEQNPLKRHPDYDVYIRRFQCEQSPPTPIQPLSDDPGPGPQHRPVFRPEIEERPSAEDYLISGDLGYGKPPDSYRPDDASNTKPDFDVGPSYGDYKPQNIPYKPKPERPNDQNRPQRPNDLPYGPNRPNDEPYGSNRPHNNPYGSNRPNDPPYEPDRPHDQSYGSSRPDDLPYGLNRPNDPPYGSNRPNDQYKPSQRPEPYDILQFEDNKPKPPADEYSHPYRPEKPDYHYIIRPNRKPRPQNDDPGLYGHPSGPIGPPNRPYRPTRPYDKPIYTYHGQYASNYGQNTQNDNSIYVEINDPPRPYIPIKDRPNQQYNGQGYLGYGTYSSQNSYSQSQNSQYNSFSTEIGGYVQKPGNRPYEERPLNSRPGYGSQKPNDYEKPYGNQGGHINNQVSYGSNQGGYGNQDNYGSSQISYNINKGAYTGNKGSYNQAYDSQYSGNRPASDHNHGETGYDQRPNYRPNNYDSYGSQNSYKGSYGSSYNEHGSQSLNSHATYENHRPYDQSSYGKPGKPDIPYDKPYYNQGSYGSNKGDQGNNQGGYGSNQGGYSSNQAGYGSNQAGYGSSHGGYGSSHDGYGSSHGGYGSNSGGYSSNHGSPSTESSYGSSGYGNNQGNYGTLYSNNQGAGGYGNRPEQFGDGGYGSNQASYGSNQASHGNNQASYGNNQASYGSNQAGYGVSHGGYGLSSSSQSYGSGQSHGETQYADHSTYGGYGNRPNNNNRPINDYERPGYSQRPSYNNQKPDHDQTAGYGQKPSSDSHSQNGGYGQLHGYNDPKPGYEDPKPGYDSQKPGYNNPKPGYNDPKPGYNDPKPGYNDPKPGYNDPKPGYNDPKPDYNDPKPGYNDPKPDNDKPDPPYLDVRPVYEYEMDKPLNVPAYIAKPGGEVVTSRPVVIGDYGERPVYKEPGLSRKDVSYRACFRRVLAGQRALRSFVRRVVPCERLEDCRKECAEERRFHCESFNYRLDPSYHGKGLCELMTKPIEEFDIRRDFVQDKDYDFYEIDRNSLEPNCPETLRGPGLLHSGFLSSKDRIDRPNSLSPNDRNRPNRLDPDDRNRPNRVNGWRDRNEWVGGSGGGTYHGGYKGGNRRYEDRFVPYQIGIGRAEDDKHNWGQYGGIYGGSQYYNNRNDYHKSITHWGLTSERPTYGVKPYDLNHKSYDHGKENDFDYYSLGKNLRKYFESHSKDEDFDFPEVHRIEHDRIDYNINDKFDNHDFVHSAKDFVHNGKDFDFDHALSRDDSKDSFDDFYGVGKLHTYGYGAWKKGRWNISGVTNVIDEDVTKTHYDAADRSDETAGKDCFARRRPGMSLSTGAVRRSLIARSVVACEAACFGEKEFKCVSYSYRYSNSRGSDNCFLSERPFHGLNLSADSGSDVYGMPLQQGCSTVSHTPWIESECFYHVRSDTAVSGPAVHSSLTVAGLGACEAECIRAQGFFCRGFSFRFDAPVIGEELHNCILTSSPTPSLSGESARRAGGHELYARGNYGRGCEPHVSDDKDNGECYLQYDKAAKLTPSATRARARAKDEQSCSSACTKAPFRCLSFSYNNNAGPKADNCVLSEIRIFDLQQDVDYVHSEDDWLFAFDLFNSRCWQRLHAEEPHTSEIPHPIQSSSEEDFPSHTGTGYLPDTSGPSGPPSGPPDTPYVHGSGPPSGPGYHPHSEPEHKPHYPPSSQEKPYPAAHYKPGESYPGFKPGYPDPSFESGYGPPDHNKPGYRPDESYKPGYRPDESFRPGGRPDEPYRPSGRPDKPYRPNYRPDESYKPGYRPEEPNTAYRPVPPLRPPDDGYKPFRPEPRPDFRPDPRPDVPGPYRPGLRPPEPYPGKPADGYNPGYRPGSGDGFKPGNGERPGYLPDRRPGERPVFQGDREDGALGVSWRHYTVSGFPCRTGTTCAQNLIAGHWACEPEGGEIGSWDYCCAPSHRCGYSEGFHKPWCYVGPKEDQWRPCSEKYYPYHQHNVPHPSSQGHREGPPRPWRDTPSHNPSPSEYTPHWDQPRGPYLSPADKQYWDDLYRDGPRAYYDRYGNPLPGYSRVPTEERPRIRSRYNPSRPGSGTWVPVSYEEPAGVPGSLGAPRYWPVAYLHKDPPPNITYFRYNETRPTTTERNRNEQTTPSPLPPQSRDLPEPRTEKPNDLDAKSTRDDKKINISKTDEVSKVDLRNDTLNTTTEVTSIEKQINISEVESMKTENYKDIDRIDGIDDKLDDFSKSIEVFDIEDAKDDKSSDLKMLEAEERQIEAIGRLLAARRGSKLVLEKRSQKDLETKNIAVDKDLVDFNFGNRFPISDRPERRGVIKRISKDEIERDRNIDRSLEVSETTFVRPPRVLTTTENIRKAIVNGKVFYDATIREQRDIFVNSTQKPIVSREESPFVTSKNFREQRDIYLNSTRKPKHLRHAEAKTNASNSNTRRPKNLRSIEDLTVSNINLREERDTRQNKTRKMKRRQDNSTTTLITAGSTRELRDLYLNSSRKAKSLKRLEENSSPSVIANNNFGKRKVLIPRNTNPVRRVRRVYRKRYNPEEVRKRLLERDRIKNSTEYAK